MGHIIELSIWVFNTITHITAKYFIKLKRTQKLQLGCLRLFLSWHLFISWAHNNSIFIYIKLGLTAFCSFTNVGNVANSRTLCSWTMPATAKGFRGWSQPLPHSTCLLFFKPPLLNLVLCGVATETNSPPTHTSSTVLLLLLTTEMTPHMNRFKVGQAEGQVLPNNQVLFIVMRQNNRLMASCVITLTLRLASSLFTS